MTGGNRYILWRALRGAVAVADTDGAHDIAKRLGYTRKANRVRLIETLWKAFIRKAKEGRT